MEFVSRLSDFRGNKKKARPWMPTFAGMTNKKSPAEAGLFFRTKLKPFQSAATMIPMLLATGHRRDTPRFAALAGEMMLRDHARHG